MTSNPARFRYRASDGSEISVDSAQELAERVEAGDVVPDTPLYDASVGQWVQAGENPVFRFVVEELQSEGKLQEDPDLPLSPDPFEMHYPLRSVIPGTEESEREGADREVEREQGVRGGSGAGMEDEFGLASEGEIAEEGEIEEEGADGARTRPDPFSSVLPADWGQPIEPLPPPEDGMGQGDREGATHPDAAGEREPSDDSSGSPGSDWELEESTWEEPPEGFPREERPERDEPPGLPPTEERGPPKEEGTEDPSRRAAPRPFAVRPVAARPSRLPLVILVSAGALILLVAMGLILRGGASEDPPLPPVAQESVDPAPTTPIPEPPEDLADFFPRMTANVSAILGRHADSLWSDRSGQEGPPSGWLGGNYLANASEFPEVENYWSDYEVYLGLLRERDAELYREAVDEILIGESISPAVEARLREYLDARYAALSTLRHERYDQLSRVAGVARNLHGFLVQAEARIAYAPALGRGISADPILEAVPLDEETRRGLDELLDQLFQALDRSRGGGAPSREGLRAELHGQFGRPA